jgi:hypothetical protein
MVFLYFIIQGLSLIISSFFMAVPPSHRRFELTVVPLSLCKTSWKMMTAPLCSRTRLYVQLPFSKSRLAFSLYLLLLPPIYHISTERTTCHYWNCLFLFYSIKCLYFIQRILFYILDILNK